MAAAVRVVSAAKIPQPTITKTRIEGGVMANIRLEVRSFFATDRIAVILSTLLMVMGPLALPGKSMALTGQPLAYVVTSNNTVTVIDTGDNQVAYTVPVTVSPSHIAVTPDSKHAYVTDNNDNVIAVIETSNQTASEVTIIPVPNNDYSLYGIVASPDGTSVYALAGQGDTSDFFVSVIETATNSIATTFDIGGRYFPGGIAISPDGATLYVPYYGGLLQYGGLAIIDVATEATVAVAGIPGASQNSFFTAAVSPDNTKVYANASYYPSIPPIGDNAILIIDNSTASSTTIPPLLSVGVFSPDGKYLYGSGSGGVAVLDTATNEVVTTIPVTVAGLAITPDGRHLYVTDGVSSVAVIDTSTNKVSATISGVAGAGGIAMAPPPPLMPVSVPNVVGLTSTAASAAITGVGLVVGTVTTRSSATVPAGLVISESPIAGTIVDRKSEVNLVVSTGPQKKAQSITFPPITEQVVGVPLSLRASASSGLPVSFKSTTHTVCTVTGITATFLAEGFCAITATQAGNNTYAAAAPVVQQFSAYPPKTTTIPSITSGVVTSNGKPQKLSFSVKVSSVVPVNGGNVLISADPFGIVSTGPVTDGLATASITLPSDIKPGTYRVIAVFLGTPQDLPSGGTTTFSVVGQR
jgi:YVTN family beta-propeller protein